MKKLNPQDIAKEIKQKKISINLDEKMTNMIDELAKTLKADRTIMITNLIAHGIHPMVTYLEATWHEIMKKEDNREQIKVIETLLADISSFRKKWKTADYLK